MRLSRQSLGNALSPDSYSPNGKLSPTGQVFLNCNRFPTSRARATSRLPHFEALTGFLDRAKGGGTIYAALYELGDEELIAKLGRPAAQESCL
jgi:hypothetical protein